MKKNSKSDNPLIKSERTFLKIFYTKRALRIIPAALFCLAIYFVCAFIYKNSESQSHFGTPESIFKEATYIFSGCYNYLRYNIQNISVYNLGFFWSLCIEAHFYFLLPLLFVFAKEKKDRIYISLFSILIVVCVARPFVHPPENYDAIAFYNFASHRKFDVLLFGVLLGLLYQEKTNFQLSEQKVLFGNL